ncbi:AAA-like domain-containing protein [Vibrio alginolyticus]|uniref:AAA-like domain-containing protein n=1 Tax=Vibrio alginolyticus TaxID=663 RepID=UPI001BD27CAC|nr:AAA-like domain-containing protein [Vibrio alginolyticus]MBS9988757.1 AAA-like domain-containing protein [Vibrio alginolyticus]
MKSKSQCSGVLKTLSLDSLTHFERKIINNISKSWFITFCKTTKFKGSDYSFVFGRATDEIAEQFHFSREVLFLLTPSHHFLTRSLDFVDKLMSDYQNRLDKLCVVIISRDETLEQKIANVLLQDKESRIIVPFTYDELGGENTCQLQIERLKSSFYERDLFAYETPLKTDTYFFGRQSIIQSIYGKYQTGQCASLFGLRRIGKTSVLYAVLRMMKMRGEPGVYVDCSEPSLHIRRWNESLHFIITELSKNLFESDCINLNGESDYTERDASIKFEEDLEKIFKACGDQRILIMLDEIENITFDISPSQHWKAGLDFILFWQVIRSIFQKRPELLSFVISGVNPKSIETSSVLSYDNPIYRFITPIYLPFFEQNEVKEMVGTIGSYMGMGFDDEVFTYLTDDFGGHPFLIRQVCSKLFKGKKGSKKLVITKFSYENNREVLNKGVTDYLELIVSVLRERYPEEYELIEYLAAGDHDTFDEFYGLSEKLVEHLVGYGLVINSEGKFHFTIKSIKDYINEVSNIKSTPKSNQEKWSRVSQLRNELESNLRTLVKRNLKYKYGVVKAKEIFVSIISPESRKKQLEAMSYQDIFSSHLYFQDLSKVIEKNWQDFGPIFKSDKGRFKQYMEFINSHRADAHANDISSEDIAILEIAVDWLANQIEVYLD